MSENIVYAPWAKTSFKVHAFFINKDAIAVNRGTYEFETRTEEDTDWEWLSKQIDTAQIVYGDVCAADLRYEYLTSGVVIAKDPILGQVRLILAPVN